MTEQPDRWPDDATEKTMRADTNLVADGCTESMLSCISNAEDVCCHVDSLLDRVRTLEGVLAVIRSVHAEHADDLCWMDIDKIFAAAGLPVPDRSVGDTEAMLSNCKRFISMLCKGGKWRSYAELEAERDKLRAELTSAKHDLEVEKMCSEVHKSPFCEHSDQYAYSEDGGKHIRCLLCSEERLRTELTDLSKSIEPIAKEGLLATDECIRLRAELADAQAWSNKFESLSKSQDEAMQSLRAELQRSEAAAAAMRAALENCVSWQGKTGMVQLGDMYEQARASLRTDAGAGWTSPEERKRLQEERDQAYQWNDNLQATVKRTKQAVNNLLACIFRDGGQIVDQFPDLESACEEAGKVVVKYIAEMDESRLLQDEIARLQEWRDRCEEAEQRDAVLEASVKRLECECAGMRGRFHAILNWTDLSDHTPALQAIHEIEQLVMDSARTGALSGTAGQAVAEVVDVFGQLLALWNQPLETIDLASSRQKATELMHKGACAYARLPWTETARRAKGG